MRPVDQTKFGGDGNCWAACIATLLEVPLAEVPSRRGQSASNETAAWLAARDLCYVEVWRGNMTMTESEHPLRERLVLGWQPLIYGEGPLCILCGPSPRHAGMSHCVVGRSNGWKWETLHDPHPDRGGLADVTHLGFLLLLDPGARRTT